MAEKKTAWAAFPHATEDYHYEGASLKKNWARLHRGDAEPWPEDKAAQEAWRLYHAGQFEAAYLAGREGSASARNAAHKAACIHANYLETSEAKKTKLYQDIASRCEALQKSEPENANAYYLQAYALGRYGQLIGVAKALAEGIGGKVRSALERALEIEPKHADAHIALGTFHAEVIEKVGAMIGKMTYGASKEAALPITRLPSSSIRILQLPAPKCRWALQAVWRQTHEGYRTSLRRGRRLPTDGCHGTSGYRGRQVRTRRLTVKASLWAQAEPSWVTRRSSRSRSSLSLCTSAAKRDSSSREATSLASSWM